MNKKNEEVLDQKVSLDELETATGGTFGPLSDLIGGRIKFDNDPENCMYTYKRQIYGGSGFANCAATVEDGSSCFQNDACSDTAVRYQGMNECSSAWR